MGGRRKKPVRYRHVEVRCGDWAGYLEWLPWGWWPIAIWVSAADDPDPETLFRRYQDEEKRMKRREKTDCEAAHWAGVDLDFQTDYPLLWEHLAALTFEGEPGSRRQTSTLNMFVQDGVWKAFLKDREAGMFLAMSAPCFAVLLTAIELALGDPRAVWREDRAQGAPTAKRVNKRPD